MTTSRHGGEEGRILVCVREVERESKIEGGWKEGIEEEDGEYQ